MASNTSEIECEGPELRRLGSVRIIAIGIFVCASSLCDYAKRNHRILTFPARMVEVPVRIVLDPVYNRFPNLLDNLLVLADTMVDKVAPTLDAHTPNFVKHLARPCKVVADKVMNKAVMAANEAQAAGPQSAARYVAAESQKFLVTSTAKLWVYLNQYPQIRAWANFALPGVVFSSKAYNRSIRYGTRKGYPLVGYLPAIPMKEIAKAVHQESRECQEDIPASSRDIAESTGSPSY